jgi:putative membrane protein
MFNGLCHFGNFSAFGSAGAWGWISVVFYLVFWVGLIAGIILLVVWLARQSGSRQAYSHSNAGAILQERYARGEITREQYESMKRDLK